MDALRGLAILLVVLGHAIANSANLYQVSTYNPQYYVSSFIYTFHIPLFFLVSGYVLFGRRVRIGDRAIRLLLPFLAWIPVYWAANRYIRHFPWPVRFWPTVKDTLLHPGAGLWFLPVLFLCSMLLIPVIFLEKRWTWAGEISLLVIFVAVNLIPFDDVGVVQVKYFFAFFALGYLAAKHRTRLREILGKNINIILAGLSSLFLVLFTVLYYYGRSYSLALPFTIHDLFKTPGAYLIRYVMALLGIIACVALIRSFKTTRARTVFAWFGLVTMEIYVSHGLLLQLTFGSGWLKVLVSFATGVFLPLALAFLILRKWWFTGALFYGINPDKE